MMKKHRFSLMFEALGSKIIEKAMVFIVFLKQKAYASDAMKLSDVGVVLERHAHLGITNLWRLSY